MPKVEKTTSVGFLELSLWDFACQSVAEPGQKIQIMDRLHELAAGQKCCYAQVRRFDASASSSCSLIRALTV